jgi:hypothetical protein
MTDSILMGSPICDCRSSSRSTSSLVVPLDPTKTALSWASYGLKQSKTSPPVQVPCPSDLPLRLEEKKADAPERSRKARRPLRWWLPLRDATSPAALTGNRSTRRPTSTAPRQPTLLTAPCRPAPCATWLQAAEPRRGCCRHSTP